MAKFTPGLMGAKTTPDFGGKSSVAGYSSAGDALLDSAIKGSVAQTNKNKATKFQQAQVLRDGIVSGHFSDDMVTQVEGALDRMSKLNPNGRNYSKVLNEANAELGMTVQKQGQVTKLLERTSAAFDGDEDKKYYSKDAFFALLEDNTSLDLDSTGMNKAYQGYLKSTDNINQDVVREEFVDLLGKYKFGGSTKSGEGKVGEFTTIKQGEYSGERTQMYKLKSGVSVPVFTNSSDVPEDLVEKWGTSSKAHMAMMDNFVAKKTKGFKGTAEELEDAEMAAGQEFVLDQMKQVIPDYASISKTRENFQPGQGGGSTSPKANPSSLIATQISRALLGDQSLIGDTSLSTLNFENGTIEGFDITDQFKDIKLIPGPKGTGRPARKIFRSTDEDALYIDTGNGIVKYDESQFNDLMIMASSAGNGFTMTDANSLPEYDTTKKSFNIRQQVTDGKNTKNISDLTPAEASSGNWGAANKSLAGTAYKRFSMTEYNKSKVLGLQKAAGNALAGVENFSYDNMVNTSTNYDQHTKIAAAINTAWAGQLVTSINATKAIRSVKRPGMSGYDDRGRDKYLITYEDGEEDYITQEEMKHALQSQF
jgi:hypothetical protein